MDAVTGSNSVEPLVRETRSRLRDILKKRDDLYPLKDPENTLALFAGMVEHVRLLRSMAGDSWTPDRTLLKQAHDLVKKPVFVCGWMKSGSTLVTQLLDGHPNLLVLPGDSHLFDWMNDRLNVAGSFETAFQGAYEGFLKAWDFWWVMRLINPTGQSPFWVLSDNDDAYVDFIQYLDFWIDQLPETRADAFRASVMAYYCANPNRPTAEPKLWVEKTPGNEHHVEMAAKEFPDAKFIHIIRDPLTNASSLKRQAEVRNWGWSAYRIAKNLRDSMAAGLKHQVDLGKDRYLLVRYEDLVKDPETECAKIAEFIGIEAHDNMLVTSCNGLEARSNSMFSDRIVQGRVYQNPGTPRNLSRSEMAIVGRVTKSFANRLEYASKSTFGDSAFAATYLFSRLLARTGRIFSR